MVDALNQITNHHGRRNQEAGDACKLVDGTDGVPAEQEGGLVCVAKEADVSGTPAEAGVGSGTSGEGATRQRPRKTPTTPLSLTTTGQTSSLKIAGSMRSVGTTAELQTLAPAHAAL
jgi:hypothetical protein